MGSICEGKRRHPSLSEHVGMHYIREGDQLRSNGRIDTCYKVALSRVKLLVTVGIPQLTTNTV